MKYHTLSPSELETYNIGYMVGNRQMVITDVEYESEQERKIYRKGYNAGIKDWKRKEKAKQDSKMSALSTMSAKSAKDTMSTKSTMSTLSNPAQCQQPRGDYRGVDIDMAMEMDKEKEIQFVKELEKESLVKAKSQTDEDFDRFWAAYTPVRCSDGRVVPKGSKKETRAKFDKYIKAGVKADDIIDGAKKYLASCQANDRLSCGATVFLNQERWKDDWSAQGIQATRKVKSISSPDYVGEGSFLRRAEDDPFCADL